MSFKVKKRSGWKYTTSAGDSFSVWYAAAEGGSLFLTTPKDELMEFKYQAAGPSYGKNWKAQKFSLASSTQDSWSRGAIYLADTFPRDELSASDIEGFCIITEASAGAVLGGSFAIVLFGIPASSVPGEIVKSTGGLGIAAQAAVDHPGFTKLALGPIAGLIFDKVKEPLAELLQTKAKAVLIMGGLNSGVQAGGSVSQMLGYVRLVGTAKPTAPKPPPGPTRIPVPNKGVLIHIPNDILFAFDRSDLRRDALKALKQVEAWIRQERRASKSLRLSVEGHTDSIGTATYNLGLSNRRARTVTQWLTAHGVATAAEMKTVGWGESKPVAPNKKPNGHDDPAGRAKNRRVEIWILK